MCENRKMSTVTDDNSFVFFRCVRIDLIFFLSWKNRKPKIFFLQHFWSFVLHWLWCWLERKYSIFPRDRSISHFVCYQLDKLFGPIHNERSQRNEYKCLDCEWRWRWRWRCQKSDVNGKRENWNRFITLSIWYIDTMIHERFYLANRVCYARMTRWSMAARLCSTRWMTLPWQSRALPITETKVCRFHPAKTIAILWECRLFPSQPTLPQPNGIVRTTMIS